MEYSNKKIEDLLADDSFIRWINEEADGAEAAKWERWLRRDPANASTYSQAMDLHRKLRFKEEAADTFGELRVLQESISKFELLRAAKPGRKSYYHVSTGIAAVLLLGLVFLFKAHYNALPEKEYTDEPNFAEVATRYGQIQQLNFPDGSSVIVNANSTLTYSEPFLAEKVEFFVEGEAYFTIEPYRLNNGEKRKFTVHTPDGTVHISGTSFNVNTTGHETKVVLDSGQVEIVKRTEAEAGAEDRYRMKPGELARFSVLNDEIDVSEVRTDLFTSWRNLEWIFDETPLGEIARRIEFTYGVEVKITDKYLSEMKFSGTAPNQNLSVLLESLRILLNVPVKETPVVIIIGE